MNPQIIELCDRCARGAHGTVGHDGLRFYVGGPFPGQAIYNCMVCGDRWIRRSEGTRAFAWSRYYLEFPPPRWHASGRSATVIR
jgi:hypothetical protein